MRFGTLAVAALLAGCARPGPPIAPYDPPSPSPVGVTWRLAEVAGQPARGTGGPVPTLLLDAGRVSGNTGCNGYSGPYTLHADSLSFGALVSTRRACIDAEMNTQEGALMRSLEATRSWRMAGDTLVLQGDARGPARFVRQ